MYFVVQCGLTRRLVEADTSELAHFQFVKAIGPLGLNDDAVDIRPATDLEVEEFLAQKREPIFDDQIPFDLEELNSGYSEDHSG